MIRAVVVADAGPLIALAGCGQLELLLSVFDAIHVPEVVLTESTWDRSLLGASEISAFVQTHAKVHPRRDDALFASLIGYLDEGEAQAISLAFALNCGVLMDERIGREAAVRQGLRLFGVLGVLLQAKHLGKIKHIAPVLATLQSNGYRISAILISNTLKLAGELG